MILGSVHEWLTQHQVVAAPLVACVAAQVTKGFRAVYQRRPRWWRCFFRDGGMPSAHSAMVSAMAVATGISLGYNSEEFALALILSLIVIHDAISVRRLTGEHSRLLRHLAARHGETDVACLPEDQVGHTPGEVLVGVLVGVIVTAFIFGREAKILEVARHIGHLGQAVVRRRLS